MREKKHPTILPSIFVPSISPPLKYFAFKTCFACPTQHLYKIHTKTWTLVRKITGGSSTDNHLEFMAEISELL